jgi:hypothetical protein
MQGGRALTTMDGPADPALGALGALAALAPRDAGGLFRSDESERLQPALSTANVSARQERRA